MEAGNIKGWILTSDNMTAHNTFENPEDVKPADFRGARIEGGKILAELPSKSVVLLEISN